MEQDAHGYERELPTYNELAEQNGPNSRFGRWKGWVEKRAAERYAEETPEAREARRARGWGTTVDTQVAEIPLTPSPQSHLTPSSNGLTRTQTVLSNPPDADVNSDLPSTCQVTHGQALPPSHLRLHSFGSRFLPHSELPILSCLPLFDDQKILLGHMDGLSLLDMAPDPKSSDVSSCEPRRRDIWRGEGVYQMAILEQEQPSSSSTPFGVVLALVGAEPPDGAEVTEPVKTLRMYNLASLASLALWTASRNGNKPLEVGDWQPQHKKQKSHATVSRFKSFGPSTMQAGSPPPPPPKDWPRIPEHKNSSDSWVHVEEDDVPLRWATDFVPLASPSSRLANQSVLSFELCKSEEAGRVTAHLAVVTKQNILLYETVRGERAFRFVKEFYTPTSARNVTFVKQYPNDVLMKTHSTRSMSLETHFSEPSTRRISTPLPLRAAQTPPATGQLSLFVIFDKKAGLIRIFNSSVGELDLWEEAGHSRNSSSHASISTGTLKRTLQAPESPVSVKDTKGQWVPPVEVTLPLTRSMPHSFDIRTATTSVYLLTRGKTTHIVRSPFPMPLVAHAPLTVLKWGMHPSRIVPRPCEHPTSGAPYLQVTALGEDGIEVQELDLAFLASGSGSNKGKGREPQRVVVQAEVGPGGAGFLCMGGHWTEAVRPPLQRQESTSTVDTLQFAERRKREVGFYAWTQYAINDWRVFWLGGDAEDGEAPPLSP